MIIVFATSNIYRHLILCLFMSITLSCATPTITFSTDKAAKISLVTYQDPSADGQILGDSPQTIQLEQLKNSFIKIWGPDLAPQYWVFSDLIGSEMKVSVKMQDLGLDKDDPKKDKKDDKENKDKDNKNKNNDPEKKNELLSHESMRILLQAYHSLSIQQFGEAVALSKKFNTLQPKLAAGHIIEGISYLQQGDKDAARGAFKVAQSLDPEDANTKVLIEACN